MSLPQPAPETLSIREAIVRKALEAVYQGAHYLTGCYGAYPESSDPVVGRELYLIEDPTLENLGVHAAEIRQPKVYRCAGRYEAAGGRPLDPDIRADRQLLRDYELHNCGSLPGHYSDIGGLYPRRVQHPTTYKDWYVLGENCHNKMHFDCIGFVNWAVSQVVGLPIQFGIRMWANSNIAPVTVEDIPFTELLPGDILTRLNSTPEHIAIVGHGNRLIQAAGFAQGVVDTPIGADYQKHSRITNRWLLRPVIHSR
ncbi:MAG: hypothetical protein JXA73_21260 [Acidobacteria bacterium]|nr:hypothetical protein [Acidobacteriota bacterium]